MRAFRNLNIIIASPLNCSADTVLCVLSQLQVEVRLPQSPPKSYSNFLPFLHFCCLHLFLSSFLLSNKYILGVMASQWSSRTFQHSCSNSKQCFLQGHLILKNAECNIFDALVLDRLVILMVLTNSIISVSALKTHKQKLSVFLKKMMDLG